MTVRGSSVEKYREFIEMYEKLVKDLTIPQKKSTSLSGTSWEAGYLNWNIKALKALLNAYKEQIRVAGPAYREDQNSYRWTEKMPERTARTNNNTHHFWAFSHYVKDEYFPDLVSEGKITDDVARSRANSAWGGIACWSVLFANLNGGNLRDATLAQIMSYNAANAGIQP